MQNYVKCREEEAVEMCVFAFTNVIQSSLQPTRSRAMAHNNAHYIMILL